MTWEHFWQIALSLLAVLELAIIVVTVPWILTIKKESVSAVAWCLVVILLPFLGFVLFLIFGYNYVYRPLKRKRRHRVGFRARNPAPRDEAARGADGALSDGTWNNLGLLAARLGSFPVSHGNRVTLYHDTRPAFDDLFAAVEAARHHVHLAFFIVQPDATGRQMVELLTAKARQGVEVRLLYDAIGSRRLKGRFVRSLCDAGGQCSAFLPINLLKRRFQINLRNHRKIIVIDGRVGFTGGLNIGDEYLGRDPRFGYWRDEFLRLEGPAVAALQRVFAEDWDFASRESLKGAAYFPDLPRSGTAAVQVVESGPDQEVNTFRELVYAAVTLARERLWIATPYFVPDTGLLDALRLAVRLGVDVRVLVPQRPDHWLPYFAGRYYVGGLLPEGIKVYHYSKGMMHAKFAVADGQWGYVGTSNFDNRSLHLNFEVNCVLHTPALIAELEAAFSNDLRDAIRLDPKVFGDRPFTGRLVENCCRLLSPVL